MPDSSEARMWLKMIKRKDETSKNPLEYSLECPDPSLVQATPSLQGKKKKKAVQVSWDYS